MLPWLARTKRILVAVMIVETLSVPSNVFDSADSMMPTDNQARFIASPVELDSPEPQHSTPVGPEASLRESFGLPSKAPIDLSNPQPSSNTDGPASSSYPVRAITKTEPATALPPHKKEFWASFGLGANIQNIEQSFTGQRDKARFQNIQIPTYSVRFGFQTARFGIASSLSRSPSALVATSFGRPTMSSYLIQSLESDFFVRPSGDTKLCFGLTSTTQPLFLIDSTTQSIDIEQASIAYIAVGIAKDFSLSERLDLSIRLRFLQPLISGLSGLGDASITPRSGFDSALTSDFSIAPHVKVGYVWNLRYQALDYRLESTSTDRNGSQTFLFSSLEAQLGFEF